MCQYIVFLFWTAEAAARKTAAATFIKEDARLNASQKPAAAAADRIKIGVLGLSPGAGAGFIASNLARYLAEQGGFHPAVAELGQGGLYDSLGMDKRFAGRDFFSFHQEVSQNKSLRGKKNEYLGVNWILVPPKDSGRELSTAQRLRIAGNSAGDPVFCRLTGIPRQELPKLFWEMDRLILVIDPLPSKMLAEYRFLGELRKEDIPLFYLINKWNEGVDRKELLQYLRIRESFIVPMIPAATVYGAEYACRSVWDIPSGASLLKEPFRVLSKALLDFSE